jgi:hypothetical protein
MPGFQHELVSESPRQVRVSRHAIIAPSEKVAATGRDKGSSAVQNMAWNFVQLPKYSETMSEQIGLEIRVPAIGSKMCARSVRS